MLVVGRDLLIVLGVDADPAPRPGVPREPLLIGKINTFAQILLAACAIGACRRLDRPRRAGRGADRGGRAARRCCPGAGYAVQAIRALGAGACFLSHGARLALLGLVPLAILLLGLILFRAILLPFLVGMAAAYLLDPAADRLQRLGLGRTAATLSITVGFFVVAGGGAACWCCRRWRRRRRELATELPGYLEQLRARVAAAAVRARRRS